MNNFRVLVTGSRSIGPAGTALVQQRLDSLYYGIAVERRLTVVQGECPHGGVDLVAKEWADSMGGATSEGHAADWDRFGKSAGPRRNSEMVALGADLVMAFPGPDSRGTWDCLQKAVKAGIDPRLWPLHIYAPEARQCTHCGLTDAPADHLCTLI